MSVQQKAAEPGAIAASLATAVRRDGTAGHPYLAAGHAERGRHATANLADVMHLLCVLHGRHPGAVDIAAARARGTPAEAWLEQAADAFAAERTALSRLVASAGPVPSTPKQADCEATVHAQSHALETLGGSDRAGCAAGMVAALILDWTSIRHLMERASDRLGVPVPPSGLPDPAFVLRSLAESVQGPAAERAAQFGAQQLLIQHRGLWDLLDARTAAREAQG